MIKLILTVKEKWQDCFVWIIIAKTAMLHSAKKNIMRASRNWNTRIKNQGNRNTQEVGWNNVSQWKSGSGWNTLCEQLRRYNISLAQNMALSLHVFLAKNELSQIMKLIKEKEFFLQTSLSTGSFCPLQNHAIMRRNKKYPSSFYTR